MDDYYLQWLAMFRKRKSRHLAGRIINHCVHTGIEVPSDVMLFVAGKMVKEVEKYDEKHPDWHNSFLPPAQHIFLFPKITKALEERGSETEDNVFRRFASEEVSEKGNTEWELLKERYKKYWIKKTAS